MSSPSVSAQPGSRLDDASRLDDIELELCGTDAEVAIPGMRAHPEGCHACREDHRTLLAFVGNHNPSERRKR
jgi:hypothetical protein